MDHISDSQMLDSMAGHTTSDRQKRIHVHMDSCAHCRKRWRDLQATWDTLGLWSLHPSQSDVTESIMTQIRPGARSRPGRFPALFRIAASVLIGLLTGHLVARGPFGTQSPEPDMARALYLEMLTLNSSTGLADPLLQSGSLDEGMQP